MGQVSKSFEVVLSDPKQASLNLAVGIGTIVGTGLDETAGTSVGTESGWRCQPNLEVWKSGQSSITRLPVSSLMLVISAPQQASGTVTIPGLGFSQMWTVDADGVVTVVVPDLAEVSTTNGVQDLGIHASPTLRSRFR